MSISVDVRNQWSKGYGPKHGVRIGTTGVGVKADHFTTDGHNIVTMLTLTGKFSAIVGGTNLGVGLLAYTFPAGVHSLKVAAIDIAYQQTEANVTLDTPKIGLGSVIASGAVTDLTGTAGFDDILTEQTMDDCDGTAEVKAIVVPTAGHIVNEAAGVKTVYINAADGWAASGDAALGIVGKVWLEWTRLTSA